MNFLIKINIVAIIFAISFSANLNADCTNPVEYDVLPPSNSINSPTCVKFGTSITDIPQEHFRFNSNIVGVISENLISVGGGAFQENNIIANIRKNSYLLMRGDYSAST